MFQFYKNWMEFFFVVVMILGLLIALTAPSAAMNYVIALLSGIFAGRLIYDRKTKLQFPYFVIIAGFVIGYMLGTYYGSKKVVIVLFVLGAVIGYKLYEKKILKDTKY